MFDSNLIFARAPNWPYDEITNDDGCRGLFDPSNDDQQLRLQLECAGGGPGSRIRTAIGSEDHNFYMDRTVLPDPLWWFSFVEPWLSYKELFGFLPLEFALSLLEKAGVPPLYRLGLGFQWNFLDAERDGFSETDFAEILHELELFQKPLDIELERMEKRSTYQIWRKLRRDLRPVHQYWSEQPKFYT
jgi:hypothetical protein